MKLFGYRSLESYGLKMETKIQGSFTSPQSSVVREIQLMQSKMILGNGLR